MFKKIIHRRRLAHGLLRWKKVVLPIVLLCIVAIGVYAVKRVHIYGAESYSEAACGEEAYTYRICKICGKVSYENTSQIIPHEFGETVNEIRFETAYAACMRCGYTEKREYQAPTDIPRIYVVGDPTYPVSYATMTYVDNEGTQTAFAAMRIGRSADRTQEKDSYDVTLYADGEFIEEAVCSFGAEVGSTSRFTLNAEWWDPGKIANLAASELWEQAVMTRTSLPKTLRSLSHLGADCGYPVLLYTNGNFKGVYDLCLANDRSLFGFSERESGAFFYTYPDLGDAAFTVETENADIPVTVVHPSEESGRNRYIQNFRYLFELAETSNDRRFTQNIGRYLDVDAAIDYLIALYVFDLPDNATYYCNWVTYDGRKWIPSLYHLTDAFAKENEQNGFVPTATDEGVDSGTGLALYDKLLSCYSERFAERYAALRDGVFSEENIRTVLKKQAEKISRDVYTAECDEYAEYGNDEVFPADFADNFALHLEKIDEYFGYTTE